MFYFTKVNLVRPPLGLRRLATVPCMGATLTAVKEGTKVVRPRSDQMSKCTDKDWSGDWDWALILTMKTIPLCIIRVLRNLTSFCTKVSRFYRITITKAPDSKGCNSTMLVYRSMCVGIAVLAHKALWWGDSPRDTQSSSTHTEQHQVSCNCVRSLFHCRFHSSSLTIWDALIEACGINMLYITCPWMKKRLM